MTILVIGDSLSFGAELKDQPPDRMLRSNRQEWFDQSTGQIKLLTPSQYAWPSILGKKLKQDVVNLSLIGGSNDRIFRIAMTETLKNKYDLVICAWTAVPRFDFYYQGRELPFTANCLWAIGEHPWLRKYLTDHYDEKQMIERWIAEVVALESYFKIKNQEYLFLNSTNQWYNIENPELRDNLINNIDQSRYIVDDINMITNHLPMGPGGHTLEEGHELVAKIVYEYLLQIGFQPTAAS
jgi:hypothetical protein